MFAIAEFAEYVMVSVAGVVLVESLAALRACVAGLYGAVVL